MSGARRGRGRGGGRQVIGKPSQCICPNCGTKTPHTRGVPCSNTKCPKCGANMLPAN